MIVVIRTDASHKIGSGHVMRCITLAEALLDSGAEVQFVCREHSGNLIELVREKGFIVHELPVSENLEPVSISDTGSGNVYTRWLGTTQEKDAQETVKVLEGDKTDWLIVDHYALGEIWEMQLRPHVRKIMVIDDLADRKHDCDILLDQNYFIDGISRYEGLLPPTCTKLLGTQFALLRPEFAEARKHLKPRIGKVQRIFVFFGGTDPDNVTGKALEAISVPEFSQMEVDVVIGSLNPHRTNIEHQVKTRPRTKLHVQVDNMAELMSQADLAIGAGGATTWERLCLGLPSIVLTTAENQTPSTKNLNQDGCLKWLGNSKTIKVKGLQKAIHDVVAQEAVNSLQSNKGMEIVPGEGALKVSKILTNGILADSWTIRQATTSDCDLYWHWVNDPEVRQSSVNSVSITREEHQKWFNDKLNDSSTTLYLVESSLGQIGQVRLDKSGQHYVISYSIGRQFRGLGLGEILLANAIEVFRESRGFSLIGEVKKENIASAKVFEKLEFQEIPPPEKAKKRRFQLQFSPIVTHG
jgi:UDP-2,4-diacetamido-2,4,6-trideoxy-beta-L-altropyranose hydrolase